MKRKQTISKQHEMHSLQVVKLRLLIGISRRFYDMSDQKRHLLLKRNIMSSLPASVHDAHLLIQKAIVSFHILVEQLTENSLAKELIGQ